MQYMDEEQNFFFNALYISCACRASYIRILKVVFSVIKQMLTFGSKQVFYFLRQFTTPV
jgi:hypothetical protein